MKATDANPENTGRIDHHPGHAFWQQHYRLASFSFLERFQVHVAVLSVLIGKMSLLVSRLDS